MQRYGPPPSYPNLKVAGLNAPIPEGCAFGYHAGGWGKPPVDDYGKPLYGDVFGQDVSFLYINVFVISEYILMCCCARNTIFVFNLLRMLHYSNPKMKLVSNDVTGERLDRMKNLKKKAKRRRKMRMLRILLEVCVMMTTNGPFE